ncbi:hypothetical protein NT6N_03280 [Oceaniferula spumae]|uniref:Uncharacterized protein n=1 Tax=Oceaniferula spumae TaxID=2979115 RepID=A0AAT9FH57_9BACT
MLDNEHGAFYVAVLSQAQNGHIHARVAVNAQILPTTALKAPFYNHYLQLRTMHVMRGCKYRRHDAVSFPM